MDRMDPNQSASLEAVKGVCKIPARLTGFFSLIIQFIAVFGALAITVLIFLHVGGCSLLHLTKNTTIEPELFPTPSMLQIKDILSNQTTTDPLSTTEIIDEMENDTTTISGHTLVKKVYDGPFEQIEPVIVMIGRMELNLISVLRCSCLLYGGLCILWILSVVCLGLSLRFEILDLVYINTFVLSVALVYTLVQGILTGTLIFYQKEYNWKILFLISGTAGVYILCFIFSCCAMILLVVWYRYIDYMNGSNETCMCTSTIARAIKKRGQNRRRQAAAANYSIPEATHHANVPYIDEPPVQQFSNF
ncbi:hypothetical protein M3Y95_00108300 [Aphelenchoides besseyi]|nr:hypothetical protein M3Y95_00108300 [Aphelenchoides besseyi]